MKFELSLDEKGKPSHVYTDDGFIQTSRPFDPETDGWMEDQLDAVDFLGVRVGREIQMLVNEVNALRRKLFETQQELKTYKDAFFGRKP